jgi:hypothetical protein
VSAGAQPCRWASLDQLTGLGGDEFGPGRTEADHCYYWHRHY